MQLKAATNILCYGEFASICIHGEGLLRHFVFRQKYKKSHNETSEKLISEQNEIYGVKSINWESSSWKYLSLNDDEEVISLSHAKVYVFSDSVLYLGKMNENPPIKHCMGGKIGVVHQNTELWTKLMVSQWNLSGIPSQDSPHCSCAQKSKSSCQK